MSDRLTPTQKEDVEQLSELVVRRYFDAHLESVLPKMLESSMKLHNASMNAHGGVERKFTRVLWTVSGAAILGGASGGGLAKILALLSG